MQAGSLIVVVLILVLTGRSDTSSAQGSAQGAAEKAVAAINARDLNATKDVDCDKSGNMGSLDFKDIPKDLKAELTGSAKENGDNATAPMKMTAQGQTLQGDMVLRKQNGKWCVSNFTP